MNISQHRSCKHCISRPPNSTWLEKVKRIFKIVKNKMYALSTSYYCLFDISYLTLAFEVAKTNSDVDVVKILIYACANYSSNEMARFLYISINQYILYIRSKRGVAPQKIELLLFCVKVSIRPLLLAYKGFWSLVGMVY